MPSDIRATSRVQPHAGFGFVQAAAVADYLANLGISHLYCSPYLHVARGSMHGGDEEFPDPQAFDTFQRSTPDWEERHRKPHASRLNWHRRLIRLRKREPALLHGRPDRLRVHFDEQTRWLGVERGPVTVACSLGSGEQSGEVLLMCDPMIELGSRGLLLPADSLALLGPAE